MPYIPQFTNSVIHGDSLAVLPQLAPGSVDFVLTDPPYLVSYRDRSGRGIANDRDGAWLYPAFAEVYRVLKSGRYCVIFYGWQKAGEFLAAWRSAGFQVVGHLVWVKSYASRLGLLASRHEMAYLLVKGRPVIPAFALPDVLDWQYTGNRFHPTQKPVRSLKPLIEAFTRPGELVLDPFCGSGSTLLAAKILGRQFVGIELDEKYCLAARRRL